MKKNILLTAFATIAFFTMCKGGEQSPNSQSFVTDSVKYEYKTKNVEVAIKADFPAKVNSTLSNAVCEYINETLGGSYNGNIAKTDSMLSFYGKAQADTLTQWQKESGQADFQYLYNYSIAKVYETNTYVTYQSSHNAFTGGAHGMYSESGITFRKSDGRRFDKDMFRNTESEGFHKLIKEGLKHYFAQNGQKIHTDEQLKELLLTDSSVDYLPLPLSAPYLTPDGVTLTYQHYEIAPYAAGILKFTVPYTKIRPYLTTTILKLIDSNK